VSGDIKTNPKNIIPNITKKDTTRADSLTKAVPDSLKKNNDLQTTVVYSATDSTIMDTQNQVVYLYGDAKVTYGDVVLQADFIKLNWDKNEVFAKGTKDTVTNKTIGKPVFKQGGEPYDADEIKYNFKSRKAIIKGLITKQGDAYVQGTSVKKDNEDNLYIRNAIYTTCNLAHPHYSIRASKIKMVGKKEIVAGPFHFELNEIPLPIGLPFGFFPYKPPQENGTSGIVFPQYGDEQARGFFLREGGYYFAISENIGLKLTADLYTKGSYNFRAQSEYVKRYRYSGRFDINFGRNDFVGNELLFDQNKTNNFGIVWSHTPQSRGNSSFSASVNINSNSNNTYNRSTSSSAYLSTALSSSVQYSRNFGQNIRTGISTQVGQNTQTQAVTISNTFNAGLNQVQPFKKKNAVTERFLDGFRFGIDINGSYNISNQIASTEREYDSYPYNVYRLRDTTDLDKTIPVQIQGQTIQEVVNAKANLARDGVIPFSLSDQRIWDNAQLKTSFSVPISLPNIKLGKYINLTPGMSFSGNLYTKRYKYDFIKFNDLAAKYSKDTTAKLGAVNQTLESGGPFFDYNTSFSISTNTRLYGTINFKKGRVQGIRHIMSPSISLNYTPDVSANTNFFQTIQINNRSHKISDIERKLIKDEYISSTAVGKDSILAGDYLNISRFDPRRTGFGSQSGGISFGISNTIEMKLKAKSDTATKESEKVTLLDNFSINSNYNFFADQFQLSPISFSATSRVKKFDININGSLDPYRYVDDGFSNTGRRIDMFKASKDEKGQTDGLAQLSNFNFSIGKSFSPSSANNKKQLPQNSNLPNNDFQQTQIDHVNRNINDYVDWSVPWQFQFSYQYNYTKTGFAPAVVVSAVTFSGSLKLTEKWDFKMQSGFDFNVNKPSLTNIQVSRNLHCWQASFTWTPIASQYYGRGGTYEFNIGVTSELLKELKISRRRNAIF
jgi:lipopolysaccharide assembly outer membrane protein LptD (OstA)